MSLRDPMSTRTKIIDAAEVIYAQEGAEALTLRLITERAGVNLAAINYHFGTKEALAQEMLLRLIEPLYDERLSLLTVLEAGAGPNLRPTHIIAAVILPLMRELTRAGQASHRVAFYLRFASDPSLMIRQFVSTHFRAVSERFDEAFVRSASRLPRHEALWRSRLFINAFPGTLGNQNTASMLSELLLRPGITTKDVLIQFGAVLECVTSGSPDQAHMEKLTDDILERLANTPTLQALSEVFPVTPEHAPPLSRLGASIEESLAAAFRAT